MRFVAGLVAVAVCVGVAGAQEPAPGGSVAAPVGVAGAPVAKKVHTEKTVAGGQLVDDYGWLRERSSPEVKAYLEQENAYAERMLDPIRPLQKALYDETLSHIKQTDDTVPYRKGGYLYYTRTIEGKQYRVYCRRKGAMTAPEEVLLDLNQMAVGEKFMSVGAFQVSDDGNLLAYTTDNVGFRQYAMHVKDLRTGQVMPDTAARVTSVAWAADGKTLFYVTEDATTKRSNLLLKHVLGGAAGTDNQVFEEKDERFNVGVERTRDGKYLLLEDGSHITSEYKFLPADRTAAAWTVVEPRKDGVQYSVDEGGGLFYLLVNDTGRTFRLVTSPVAMPGKAHWKEVIASRPDVPLENVDVFHDFYAVLERVKGLATVRVVGLGGGIASKAIDVPEPTYSLSSARNEEFDTTQFRYGYTSLVTPPSTFAYDVRSGGSTLLKQVEVPGGYDKARYTTERVFAKAKDGTEVPISLVYRKDKFAKGKNALFQTAYGSYGYPYDAGFNPVWLPLLDRGVVVAIAHIRGGGEMGLPWHDGGKMMTKRNTFTDFTDCTEYLLSTGYGEKGRVGIEGASAGGLLMGAVTNMRPDLYKVVLAEVPFVDVMNTMLDASLPLTVSEFEEWGNPSGAEAFRYMRTYSPYDNVERKTYPAILVETSFDDSQVMYWEPAKYVAKLRAMKTDGEPLVFLINMHGGHGGSSGRYDALHERCLYYAFLLHELQVS